jgi:L-fuculose-phosphate aldolase
MSSRRQQRHEHSRIGGTVRANGRTRRTPLSLLRAELIEVSRLIYDRGLTVGVLGNASIRVPHLDAVLIKTTGSCMGEMTGDDTVLVGLDGAVLEGRRPSKEIDWHVGIYRSRPEIGGIVHAHPPHATAWAVAGRVPPAVQAAARDALGPIELIDFAPPGSPLLAALVTRAFGRRSLRAGLLADHGIVTVGADLRHAYDLAEHLEATARVAVPSSIAAG